MIPPTRRLIFATLVVLLTPVVSSAQQAQIVDKAGMFRKSSVEEATRTLEAAVHQYRVPILIETVETIGSQPMEAAALDAVKRSGGTGVFVFVAKDERKISVLARRQYEHRFPLEKRDEVRKAFLAGFNTGDLDAGLKKGVDEIVVILKDSASKESPLINRDRIALTLAGAEKAVSAAKAKASEMNLKVNIAVVDDGGHLLSFARMDGARPASVATAQTKAVSAATMRQATGPVPPGNASPDLLVSLGQPGAAAVSGGKITSLLGGIPIVVDGQVIGAVGIGGGTGEQDAEIAKAGATAVSDDSATKINPK